MTLASVEGVKLSCQTKESVVKKSVCSVLAFLILVSVVGFTGCGSTTWVKTGGSIRNPRVSSLAYDSQHGVLFAGVSKPKSSTNQAPGSFGVWKYHGGAWTSTGGAISSLGMSSLAYDPTHNLLYSGCVDYKIGNQGVWKYDGANWINTAGMALYGQPSCLLYDSVHDVLYSGSTDGGVLMYTDGPGWAGVGDWRYRTLSLAYDSKHNTLWAGTTARGVWKCDGAAWTNTNRMLSPYRNEVLAKYRIESLAYDPTHNSLYAGTNGGGVWKYNGKKWTNTNGALSHDSVVSLTYDSKHSLLYAGTTGDGVWVYNGMSWTNTGGGLPSSTTLSLAYDSVHNVLYAGTDYGVWSHLRRP